MKNFFRYSLLLAVFIVPIYVLMDDAEKFPIMLGAFLGITIAYWVGVWIIKIRKKKNI